MVFGRLPKEKFYGDLWTRLVSSWYSPKVKEDFPPNQVGVALKEAVPHVLFAVRCAQMGCQTQIGA